MYSPTTGDSIATEAPFGNFRRECLLYYYVIGTFVAGSFILIGLLGNCISLTILSKERKKSSTIQALCLLAVTDTCLLLAYSLFPIVDTPWAYSIDHLGILVVVFVYMFEIARVCNQVSAFITMILMWQRYVAVCLPHKSKQLCTVGIVNRISACSTVAAVVFYLPNFFLYSIKTTSDGDYYVTSNSIVKNAYFQVIYSLILTYLVSYIIPVVSLLGMSLAILRSLKSHINTVAPSANSQHARKDLTKSSIAIVVIYVLCQSLQPIRRVIMWLYDPYMINASCGGKVFYFSYLPHIALMLNSSANFVIYILFARGFRRKLIMFLTGRNAVGPNDLNESNTKPGSSKGGTIPGVSKITTVVATGSRGMTAPDEENRKCSENTAPSGIGTDDTI